jgi:hypothetical protein
MRHGAERAVNPHWQVLTDIMHPLTGNERPGCRRWAIRELGLLRDTAAVAEVPFSTSRSRAVGASRSLH